MLQNIRNNNCSFRDLLVIIKKNFVQILSIIYQSTRTIIIKAYI